MTASFAHIPNLELLLGSELPPERSVEFARQAEAMGLAGVWLAEDYFCAAGFSSAAAVLAATTRIRVGLGVASILVRHPAVTAMEIATIERMFPGRFVAGLGHGAPGWVGQMGLTPSAAVGAIQERLRAVRELLTGARVDRVGKTFSMEGVELAFPPTPAPPLALGVSGPQMLKMAAKEADLLVLSIMSSPAYVSWVRDLGRQAGREGDLPLVCFALAAVDEDGDLARRVARKSVARIVSRRPDSPLLRRCSFFDDLQKFAARGAEFVELGMSEDCLDELAISGTPQHCLDLVRARGAAGGESVVLLPLPMGVADDLAGIREMSALRDQASAKAGLS